MNEFVWNHIDLDLTIPADNLRMAYLQLLTSALMERARMRTTTEDEDISSAKRTAEHISNWLTTKTDFFEAPASTRYHDACPSGLLRHTLAVYNQIIELRKLSKFSTIDMASAVFVALVHDWCKIGLYENYMKNVKDESTGEWTQEFAYRYVPDGTGRLGHGTQSMAMAMQLCTTKYTVLTNTEMAAIRWHSSAYDVSKNDLPLLDYNNSNIPLVHMLQFADQLAITNY